jgi:hypothetical protein
MSHERRSSFSLAMRSALVTMIGFFLLQAIRAEPAAGTRTGDFDQQIRPLLDQYCITCHHEGRAKGGVNLDAFTNTVSVFRAPEVWQKLIAKVNSGEMPPDNKPQPSTGERDHLLTWARHAMEVLQAGRLAPDPGRVLIHRLSRTEYNCTVRDLLGIGGSPADNFPSEGGGGGGFDNNADTLFVPPILMERYLAAATQLANQTAKAVLFGVKRGWLISDRAYARNLLEHFARRAFRRPAQPQDLDPLLALYDQSRKKGQDFEQALRTSLSAILASPDFLFRSEADQETLKPYRINDYELASRLSYFLWSSMPDEELFRQAANKRLHEPSVLRDQARRMILDPKSKTFTENFASQWLRVRELKTAAQPDAGRFPEFTTALRDSMYREVIDFFDAIVRGNESLLDVVSSDYTFLNADLAALYGIKGVEGRQLRRIKVTDTARGGILGMGAILTLTSYPMRTSPVLRGKWVLEEILGTPPPPPPPLVKSLPQDDSPVEGLTLRQQLEKHRSQKECAACHQRMDPLGFGLENFDPIGRWRTRIAETAVDASGVLPNGEKFQGPAELKTVLLNQKVQYIRNISQKMLAYALGRGLDYYDAPTVERIVQTMAAKESRSWDLIEEIVGSFPFQFRRNAAIEPEAN